MAPTIDQMILWARGAGEILREGYGKRHAINHKGRIDLVTEMDHLSEAYLVEKIRAHAPQDTIYSEESGRIAGSGSGIWYIDPLDGTTNYAHHIPIFSVSIGYADQNGVQLGVVYEPMRDECFTSIRGQGSWLNGERLRVSDTQEMVFSLLVTGFPYDSYKTENNNVANFAHFTRLSQGVRRLGSAAVDLCYVAAGRFDGYWEISLKPYDLAAGALIVQEAGGIVTSMLGGEDLFLSPCSIVAATPAIHSQMLAEFNKLLG